MIFGFKDVYCTVAPTIYLQNFNNSLLHYDKKLLVAEIYLLTARFPTKMKPDEIEVLHLGSPKNYCGIREYIFRIRF